VKPDALVGVVSIRLFEDFSRRLRADLDVEPSPETLNLVKQIRER
jgi:DNA-binding SARP family transcriptional activator